MFGPSRRHFVVFLLFTQIHYCSRHMGRSRYLINAGGSSKVSLVDLDLDLLDLFLSVHIFKKISISIFERTHCSSTITDVFIIILDIYYYSVQQ